MNCRKNERGAAVVEFAILATLLIIFLFGIFEFGFLWISSFYVSNSAREGARVAAKIGGSEATDESARNNMATDAVKKYLSENFIFVEHIDDSGFVSTTYNTGSVSVTVDSDTITTPMAEVTVTVDTAVVWEPILFPIINALSRMLTGKDQPAANSITQITGTASYAIE